MRWNSLGGLAARRAGRRLCQISGRLGDRASAGLVGLAAVDRGNQKPRLGCAGTPVRVNGPFFRTANLSLPPATSSQWPAVLPRVEVCGLSLSIRHGVHPTCRPALRQADASLPVRGQSCTSHHRGRAGVLQ